MSELSIAAFRQMCGRAGRLGLDECGEAVLMLPNSSRAMKELAVHLVTAPMPPLLSSLQVGVVCMECHVWNTCYGYESFYKVVFKALNSLLN